MSFFAIVLIISSISFLFVVVTNTRRKQELSEYTIQLEATNSELEAFSYSVSHDLQSPLGSVDGFSKLLLTKYFEVLDDKGKHYLDRIRAGIQNMGNMIDDILLLSRVSRSEINYEMIDLTHMCLEILDHLQQSNPERKIELDIEGGLTLRCDPGQLRVAMTNLLSNAWKFTSLSTNARIEIGKTSYNERSVFYVRDNGAGFDMGYAKKLFTPFQRLHSEAEFTGSGIGLATVQRIVNKHGGSIWATGEVGEGATFYFTFEGVIKNNDRRQ
jgi:light-regulated signal transduction histidine kinase (bacteriophytochrome)